jgi:hypothetical protein
MYKTIRRALAALLPLAAVLALHSSSALACTSSTPTPPTPWPDNPATTYTDANTHAIVCSTTSLHMGDAEWTLANLTYGDWCSRREQCPIDGTDAWVGSWDTRPLKPVPGQPREVFAEVFWYNTTWRQACEYEGVLQGVDVSMTLEAGTGLWDGCFSY